MPPPRLGTGETDGSASRLIAGSADRCWQSRCVTFIVFAALSTPTCGHQRRHSFTARSAVASRGCTSAMLHVCPGPCSMCQLTAVKAAPTSEDQLCCSSASRRAA